MKKFFVVSFLLLHMAVGFAQKKQATSLDGRKLFPMKLSPVTQAKYDSLLEVAQASYESDPDDLDKIIWLGRRTAYLGNYREAVKIYSKGIKKFPQAPELYRHRGHRYISTRKFDKAIRDFEKAAKLAENRDIEIEPDGLPNRLNQPSSNLHFNIYYHLGLAHYLKGDLEKAIPVYKKCMKYSVNDDLLTATADWLYMTYRRVGEEAAAKAILAQVTPEMTIVENDAYHKRLLMYKGLIEPKELLDLEAGNEEQLLQLVTQGYGVGSWYFYNGKPEKAMQVFKKIVTTKYWSAFGYIAAEAELAR